MYQACYQFAKEIYRLKVKLPKTLKNDLGQEAFATSLKVVKCVALASRSQDKSRLILRLLAEIEAQWVFLRLLFDLRGISEGEFKVLSERGSDIEKPQVQVRSDEIQIPSYDGLWVGVGSEGDGVTLFVLLVSQMRRG